MKALILSSVDDIPGKIVETFIKGEFSKHNVTTDWINLTEKSIEYCNGCGFCSSKKPGLCAKKDDMIEILPKMANSEILIFFSNISFGGYDSQLKKVVDRYSVLGLQTYSVYKGELHHPSRYPNPTLFMSIGILPEENKKQEQTFELVSERIATCTFSKNSATVVLKRSQEEKQIIHNVKEAFNRIGVNS